MSSASQMCTRLKSKKLNSYVCMYVVKKKITVNCRLQKTISDIRLCISDDF